jgi:alpha-tubulin suppressor-like RCC1 family protein
VVEGIEGATQVALGQEHSCALLADGRVKCWGFLQGGLPSGPSYVPEVHDATQIAAGTSWSCARLTTGAVSCWATSDVPDPMHGNDRYIGIGVLTGGATSVAVGAFHACAVVTDGAVVCMGSNTSGQLGDGTMARRHEGVTVQGLTHVRRVALGGDFSCAMLDSDDVYCWGQNAHGQLGDGTRKPHLVPARVAWW